MKIYFSLAPVASGLLVAPAPRGTYPKIAAGNENHNKLLKKKIDDVAATVAHDTRQNFRISDEFASFEKADAEDEKKVRTDPNMMTELLQKEVPKKKQPPQGELAVTAPTVAMKTRTDSVEAQISQQRSQAIDIHSTFAEHETADAKNMREIKSNQNLKELQTSFLQQTQQPSLSLAKESDAITDYVAKYNAETTTGSDHDATDIYGASDENNAFDLSVPKKTESFSVDYNQEVPHTSNAGGQIITVPLSSQLQKLKKPEAFTQIRAESSALQRFGTAALMGTAPGTDEEVAKEKKWDVYLSDTFANYEARDASLIKKIKARRDMKE